ncbi:MAG: nucleotidyltransferase domain-containing protein [Clostridia bacterium]|nr:nucleotidyltransferase domain-containing protein [Clostridia bacterium]
MPTITDIRAQFLPILKKYKVHKAILFGSFAKGCATENSDIDLLVDSGLRGLRFVGLLDELSEISGRSVDLLDVTHVQKASPVAKEIEQTGVVIYEA